MGFTTRTDLVLAAILSALLHYAVFTAIPRLRLTSPGRPTARSVELELVPPRTEAERNADMPEIALPSTRPEAPDAPDAQEQTPQTRQPEAAKKEPEPEPQQQTAERTQRQKLPDDFLQSVDLDNAREEEAPKDPHFLAQKNMNVEEETVARSRSLTKRDAESEPSAPDSPREPTPPTENEEPGNSEEDVAAEQHDRPGERALDTAAATPEGTRETEPDPAPGRGGPRAGEAREEIAAVESIRERGLEGVGDFPIERQEGREGRAGQEGRRGGGTGRGANLKLSWGQFNNLYGEGELAREREAIAERRRSSTRGKYARNWERIRSSMENYVPHVRAGNQTALRAAQSPFARYLAEIHRRIHRFWADGFLVDLLGAGDHSPLNDFNLRTDVEIVIAGDGSVADVGIVRTSGQLAFDAAAVDSALRSGPHPSPPSEIKSGDGRVYLHWGFYRNARQCGTFNATPFLLPSPPGMPHDTAAPAEGDDAEGGSEAPAGEPHEHEHPSVPLGDIAPGEAPG